MMVEGEMQQLFEAEGLANEGSPRLPRLCASIGADWSRQRREMNINEGSNDSELRKGKLVSRRLAS